MKASFDVAALHGALLAWFDAHGRTLPWRVGPEGGRSAYPVWVSEVLLQQTQVSRGLVYFQRFLERFPTVEALAQAPQEDVLKAWEGCGYYARARNLQKGAQQVVARGWPQHYHEWLSVPGVGPYTAAAIASLSLGEVRAVSDGNVRRVLARLYAEAQPSAAWVQEQADTLIDPQRPAAWNEALMDLGATICTPKAPACPRCPWQAVCRAHQTGQPTDFPAPKIRAKVQAIHLVALLIGNEQQAVLEQRTGNLLGGLWGLPSTEILPEESLQAAATRLCERLGAHLGEPLGEVTHQMTHRLITMTVFRANADAPRQQVAETALSRLDHKALSLWRRHGEGLFG